MKKFSKVVLILAAVCFTLGVVITAAAAIGGGTRQLSEKLRQANQDRIRVHDDDDDWDDWDDLDDADDWDDFERRILDRIESRAAAETGAPAVHHEEEHHPDSHYAGSSVPESSGAGKASSDGTYGLTSRLEIEVEAGNVEIVEGTNKDEIQVQLYSDDIILNSRTEGSERKLEFRRASGINGSTDARAVVTVPAGYEFDQVSLDVQAGSIKADRILARVLELDAEAGDLQVKNGSAQRLEAGCDLGSLEYTGSVSSNLEADCEAGSLILHLDGSREDFNYIAEIEAGTVQIDGESLSRGGKRTLTNKNAAKSADLECELGTIAIDFANR